jgi:hypothetical protein
VENGTLIQNDHALGGTGGSEFRGGAGGAGGNTSGGGLYIAVNGNFAGGLPGLKLSYQSWESYGGGVCIAAGIVTLSHDAIENHVAIAQGGAIGAGVSIASHATVYVDAFTLSNLVGNTRSDSDYSKGTVDNIDGTYTLNSSRATTHPTPDERRGMWRSRPA